MLGTGHRDDVPRKGTCMLRSARTLPLIAASLLTAFLTAAGVSTQTAPGTSFWMPTTHEFGPQGLYGDWAMHDRLATRFPDKNLGFRNSSEYLGGTDYYISDSRNVRPNAQFRRVNHSPVSSSFGYYVGGEDGGTLSAGLSVFF